MDTEEKDEGCVNVIQCDGMDDTASGWRMPDASWLYIVEADAGELLVANVMKAGGKRPPKCLINEEKFRALRKQKECESKKKIEAG
jgi:hypothetical protein